MYCTHGTEGVIYPKRCIFTNGARPPQRASPHRLGSTLRLRKRFPVWHLPKHLCPPRKSLCPPRKRLPFPLLGTLRKEPILHARARWAPSCLFDFPLFATKPQRGEPFTRQASWIRSLSASLPECRHRYDNPSSSSRKRGAPCGIRCKPPCRAEPHAGCASCRL